MARSSKKTKIEKLVENLPISYRNGRKKIAKGLYFDFPSKCYYFYTGKKENEHNKNKVVPIYYIEKDPIRMEQFISDYDKINSQQKQKTDSALSTQETVSEYLTYFIKCQRYDEKATIIYYKSCNKRICNVIGNIKLCDLTVNDCEKYINYQLKHYSPATVRKDYDFMHMALSKAIKSRKIIFNPIDAVSPPKTPSSGDQTGNIHYYNAEDALKIISYCTKQAYTDKDNKFHNEDPNNIYAWAILFVIYTGIRREEVCGLKFKDFHVDESVPYVSIVRARTDTCKGYNTKQYETKGTKNKNSIRNISIDEQTVKLYLFIKDRYNKNKKIKDNFVDSQFVISYSDGTIPHPGTISQKHKKMIIESGVERTLDFKALRHTFATLSRDGGDVTPFDLQDAMGHASIKTTEKYYLGQTKIIKTGALNSFKKMLKSIPEDNNSKNLKHNNLSM